MSQDEFQWKMVMILGKFPDTLELMDDIIVYSKTKEDHDQNPHNLMKIAQIEGLRFNGDKCTVDEK